LLADLGALKIKYPTSVVVARRAFVAQERTVAKRFLMALVDGLHLYRQNKNLAIQVLQKYTKIATTDILSQSYNYQLLCQILPRCRFPKLRPFRRHFPPINRPIGRSKIFTTIQFSRSWNAKVS
jgi:hypothetical protein